MMHLDGGDRSADARGGCRFVLRGWVYSGDFGPVSVCAWRTILSVRCWSLDFPAGDCELGGRESFDSPPLSRRKPCVYDFCVPNGGGEVTVIFGGSTIKIHSLGSKRCSSPTSADDSGTHEGAAQAELKRNSRRAHPQNF